MNKTRLEAFSDGVIAIIITIMVLELKVPHSVSIDAVVALWPVFLSYVLSFIYVGIYWNNHHHLLHAARSVSGGTLWANLHLLFWLSLIPFATGWMGENHFANVPAALYGGVLLLCAIAYTILQARIVAMLGKDSSVARSIGKDAKGKLSLAGYIIGIGFALMGVWLESDTGLIISLPIYALVALLWLIPDRRIEKALASDHAH
jgi:uncharacterized membrane protein